MIIPCGDLLFAKSDLRRALLHQESIIFSAIDKYSASKLLNTSTEDLVSHLFEKYKAEIIKLSESEITVDQQETNVNISGRTMWPDDPQSVKGTKITFFIPFEGDKVLFEFQPSQFTLNPPRAKVSHHEIEFVYETTQHDSGEVKKQFDSDFGKLKQYLEWVTNQAEQFNQELSSKIRTRIEVRKEKLLNDQDLVSSLGFKLRKRDGVPTTYTTPSVKRKIRPQPPRASSEPYKPEPTLEMKEYEHILSVITNMVMVMERSPSAFQDMNEEDLRTHFLVQLNGHYEGQATGETFNYEGKTDILIRNEGKNIFIAECKFWKGPKALLGTIDQILGYTSWRDTKIALLVFNRTRNFSAVLEKIPGVIKNHPNYKRELTYKTETGSRYVMHHKDNKNREIILTLLAFEVPV